MRFTINRSALLKVLNIVNIAVGQKSPTPAYLNFKIIMEDEQLTILGSNNELTIKSFIPRMKGDKIIITNSENGEALISAKYLLDIIRSLDGENITMEIIDSTIVKITDEKSDFKLNSMRAEEYPDIDLDIDGKEISFDGEVLKTVIAQTAFAAATKEVRPVLTAINVKADGSSCDFTATDSYRLSKKTVQLNDVYHFEANIPVKTLQEVAKLIDDNSPVKIFISEKKAVFLYQDTTIYSRLINSDFPKTSRMIPDTYRYVLQVNAASIINAMQRVSLLAIERENIVKLSLSNDKVEISSKSDQIGSANECLDLFKYEGELFDISYNVNYVVDAIKAAMSEEVILSFAGEISAFKVSATDDPSIVQIITPVRSY